MIRLDTTVTQNTIIMYEILKNRVVSCPYFTRTTTSWHGKSLVTYTTVRIQEKYWNLTVYVYETVIDKKTWKIRQVYTHNLGIQMLFWILSDLEWQKLQSLFLYSDRHSSISLLTLQHWYTDHPCYERIFCTGIAAASTVRLWYYNLFGIRLVWLIESHRTCACDDLQWPCKLTNKYGSVARRVCSFSIRYYHPS